MHFTGNAFIQNIIVFAFTNYATRLLLQPHNTLYLFKVMGKKSKNKLVLLCTVLGEYFAIVFSHRIQPNIID